MCRGIVEENIPGNLEEFWFRCAEDSIVGGIRDNIVFEYVSRGTAVENGAAHGILFLPSSFVPGEENCVASNDARNIAAGRFQRPFLGIQNDVIFNQIIVTDGPDSLRTG